MMFENVGTLDDGLTEINLLVSLFSQNVLKRFYLRMNRVVLIQTINPAPLLEGSPPESGKLVGSGLQNLEEVGVWITRQTLPEVENRMILFFRHFWEDRQ